MQRQTLRHLISAALLLPASAIANSGFVGTPVLPDYVITDMQTYEVGSETLVEVTVANQGADPDPTLDLSVSSNNLFVFATSGGSTYSASTLFKSWSIATTLGGRLLAAGESVTLSTRYETARLRGQIWAMVDQFQLHEESNEDNNVFPRADLSPDYSISLMLDDDGSRAANEILQGDLARFVITATPDGDDYRDLAAVVSLTNASGSTVYRSGELPLVAAGDSYEGEAWISTLALDSGDYQLNATVIDANGELIGEAALSVSIVGADENNAPVAGDDEADTPMDEPVLVDVVYNDYDEDGDYLSHHVVGEVRHGTVQELRGSMLFTPDPGFVGTAGFRYQLNDLFGGSDWAEVTVNVRAPESGSCSWVRDFAVKTTSDRVVVDGWSDYALASDERPQYAAVVLDVSNSGLFEEQPFISHPSCSLYFTPKAGAVGSATLTYAVMDKETGGEVYRSAERSFEITLLPTSDAPEVATTPDTLTNVGSRYGYTPSLASNGAFRVTATSLPDFLTLNEGMLTGIPGTSDIGLHDVVLNLTQGQHSIEHAYKLIVEPELAASAPEATTPSSSDVLEDDSEASATQGYVSVDGGGAFGAGLGALLAGLGLWRRRR